MLIFEFPNNTKAIEGERFSRSIEVQWVNPNQLRLILSQVQDRELFCLVCEDLIRATQAVSNSSACIDTLVSRLTRWRRFLSKHARPMLSEQQIYGLLGELEFLRQELLPVFGPSAIDSWNGPVGGTQDFALADCALEIKVRTAANPSLIIISSAEQLWSTGAGITLVVYMITKSPKKDFGVSLFDVVESIRDQLAGSSYYELFETRLLEVGYLDLPEYRLDFYSISGPECYSVADGFPCLLPNAVPSGVSAVTYRIHLNYCEPFRSELNLRQVKEQ